MSDRDDDEMTFPDDDRGTFEQDLFRAIREYHRLEAEMDDELHRLVTGEYAAPSFPEPGTDDRA